MSINVSVVIPNFNGKRLLATNLPQVINASLQAEIIVVDDASTDDSVALLHRQFPQIKIVQHPRNRRFAAACNTGVTAASGEIVVLLNTDVIPKPGYLEALLLHFKDDMVFSVGCKEIEQSTTQMPDAESGRTEGAFRRGLWVHWRPEDQASRDTFWTFGGSMAVDRRKYLELGGMDELFAPAYWEDIDLCFRAQKKGWQVIFDKEAVVYHVHETTNTSVFGKRRMELMAYRNQLLFAWKHMTTRQWFAHLCWLPYHLIFTTMRSRGLFLQAWFQALFRWFTYDASHS